jgi:DNA invertase Pin-like site-specific DNA recombinase
MLIGYARVSTTDQNLTLQKDALEKAGCERIYEDELSTPLHSDTPSGTFGQF